MADLQTGSAIRKAPTKGLFTRPRYCEQHTIKRAARKLRGTAFFSMAFLGIAVRPKAYELYVRERLRLPKTPSNPSKVPPRPVTMLGVRPNSRPRHHAVLHYHIKRKSIARLTRHSRRFCHRKKYHPEPFGEELDYCECRGSPGVRAVNTELALGDRAAVSLGGLHETSRLRH